MYEKLNVQLSLFLCKKKAEQTLYIVCVRIS